MRDIGGRRLLSKPETVPGLLITFYFAVKLLAYLHLSLIGKVTPGMSGRLDASRLPEPGGDVIYFYQVDDITYHGWRRGIQYGGQMLSVVYSPLRHAFHVTSTQRDLKSPFSLWKSVDYWLRLGLASAGVVFGLLTAAFPRIWRNRNWRFLHGLDRRDNAG